VEPGSSLITGTRGLFELLSAIGKPTLMAMSSREEINMAKQEPTPAGKARAASIHAEIAKLTGGKAAPLEAEEPGNTTEKAPLTPRDFINQWMAEHDKKKSEEK
jgi:hypothetical protein